VKNISLSIAYSRSINDENTLKKLRKKESRPKKLSWKKRNKWNSIIVLASIALRLSQTEDCSTIIWKSLGTSPKSINPMMDAHFASEDFDAEKFDYFLLVVPDDDEEESFPPYSMFENNDVYLKRLSQVHYILKAAKRKTGTERKFLKKFNHIPIKSKLDLDYWMNKNFGDYWM
jgi:hypothetical protein